MRASIGSSSSQQTALGKEKTYLEDRLRGEKKRIMQTNNSGLITTISGSEQKLSTRAAAAGPAFFKRDFSDLTASTYIQMVSSTLSAAEIYEKLSKSEDDDERLLFVSIIVSHFAEAYAYGRSSAGRRREPAYRKMVKFIFTPNWENEMAIRKVGNYLPDF